MTRGIAVRIALATLLLGALAGGVAFTVAPIVLGEQETDVVAAAAVKAPVRGFIYDLPARVLNLSPGGRFNYLKINIALEFDPPADPVDEAAVDPLELFRAAIAEGIAAVEDGINTAITSRNSSALAGAEGKAKLKEEIRRLTSAALGVPVRNVFFTQFVMQ